VNENEDAAVTITLGGVPYKLTCLELFQLGESTCYLKLLGKFSTEFFF
jgi:hypothetical protein